MELSNSYKILKHKVAADLMLHRLPIRKEECGMPFEGSDDRRGKSAQT
ncbi:hypothetical protein BpOF4_18215 [Alkalihalophilus pseudofirmus OF4]|uniref:Uncharacterized protein n=1 Tax=Alkalihalophilus pseudofirmus (strain ATCC BAA-2126 / JCM 17055 / OF4) TaxID=398511 RepID=D3FS49_ALKPO|nr:hypothetical protein BpOF4_18215 [Alkalihalophilus pseudofirmus OF4]